jgi:hypothetical protein
MSRQHSWRAEHPDAVIVARPSRWGSPWTVEEWGGTISRLNAGVIGADPSLDALDVLARQLAVICFREAVLEPREYQQPGWYPGLHEIRAALAGRDLACWCPLEDEEGNPVPCHADVLLEIANGAPAPVAQLGRHMGGVR